MSIARITEMKASSTVSFEDAIRAGLARAVKTLENVKSAWISEQEVFVDEQGKINEYRVLMKVTFIVSD